MRANERTVHPMPETACHQMRVPVQIERQARDPRRDLVLERHGSAATGLVCHIWLRSRRSNGAHHRSPRIAPQPFGIDIFWIDAMAACLPSASGRLSPGRREGDAMKRLVWLFLGMVLAAPAQAPWALYPAANRDPALEKAVEEREKAMGVPASAGRRTNAGACRSIKA